MKKSFLVVLLAGLLSIPSAVFAEASWYGSIRAGWTSASGPKDTTAEGHKGAGVSQFGSRWGIKGTSEVSDGLSAVYKFETRIKPNNQDTAHLYAGLSGGFGTVSLGKLQTADDVHVGFVDNSGFLGGEAGLIGFTSGSSVSYASPSIGGFSFQVDVQGDRSKTDKDVNSAQFGATLQLGDNAKIGVAYVDRATKGADTPVYERKASTSVTSKLDTDKVRAELNRRVEAAEAADLEDGNNDDRDAIVNAINTILTGGGYTNITTGPSSDVSARIAGLSADQLKAIANDTDAGRSATTGFTSSDIVDVTTSTATVLTARSADDLAHLDDDRTAMIAAQYRIGGMALHLGYGQRKWDTDSKAAEYGTQAQRTTAKITDDDKYLTGLAGGDLLDKKQKTTFFGVGGGIGDTGVNFFLQVKDTKTTSNKVTHSYADKLAMWNSRTEPDGETADQKKTAAEALLGKANVIDGDTVREVGGAAKNEGGTAFDGTAGDTDADRKRGSEETSVKKTPFTIGLSRSLGGGASIHLEHDNTDDDASHNQTALILKVDF